MFNFVRFLLASLVFRVRVRDMRRLLLFLLFSPLFVFAEEYRWTVLGQNYPITFLSGTAACAFVKTKVSSITSISFSSTGERTGVCTYFYDNGSSIVGPYSDYYVQRYGDSCPIGTVYKSETGECLPPEPEPDQCENRPNINSWAPATKDSNGFYQTNVPTSACLNGCGYQSILDFGHRGCVRGLDGQVRCAVSYSSTNSTCSDGVGGDDLDGQISDLTDDDTPDPTCDRFTNTDGSWGYDCSAKPPPDDDTCPPGYMLQATTCFRIPPDHPNYDPAKDPHNNNQGGDGDGGGEGKGDESGLAKDSTLKDIDKTLKGIDSSIKSGDGTTHGLLRGVIDAINNKPVGGGGGGKGDGSGSDGEDEDDSSVSGGETCDNPPICLGDALQCEIIKQQFTMRCEFEEAYDFESVSSDIESAVSGDEFSLYEAEQAIEIPSFITGNARWLSGRCPPPEQLNLRLAGGRTFELSYEPLCQAADFISPLIVIIATVMATLYVGRSAGG